MPNSQKNCKNFQQKLISLAKGGIITISRNRKEPEKSPIQSELKQKLNSLVQAGNLTISRSGSSPKKKFSQNSMKIKPTIKTVHGRKLPINSVHESKNDVVFESLSTLGPKRRIQNVHESKNNTHVAHVEKCSHIQRI